MKWYHFHFLRTKNGSCSFLSLVSCAYFFLLNAFQKRNGYNQGKRRMNSRTSNAQQDEVIRRTVYVSDIDQQVNSCTFLASYCSLFCRFGVFFLCTDWCLVNCFSTFLYVRLLKSSLQDFFLLVDRYLVFYFVLIFSFEFDNNSAYALKLFTFLFGQRLLIAVSVVILTLFSVLPLLNSLMKVLSQAYEFYIDW